MELAACSEYRNMGRDTAEENYKKLREAFCEEGDKLRDIEQQQDYDDRLANDEFLKEQQKEIQDIIRSIDCEIHNNIAELNQRGADFTVVLYGRTMAGKSTLMEILTHGDGKSIGKGAQRTTLDVRSYMWNGLKILDVPGIASFEGEVDDKLAYEAAKTADMALFLLTDDAPQASEADRLAELKALGKPILGVVNVKQVLNADANSTARKMELKKLTRKMAEKERLAEIVKQFNEFGQKSGYDFSDIKWVDTHLQAAYFSQAEREDNKSLYELSNFSAVEEFIAEKIKSEGQFICYKNYVDNVAIPMQKSIAMFYRHSADTVEVHNTYLEKIEQFDKWREKFSNATRKRYDNFIKTLKKQFDAKIGYVVNNYYDSSNAGEEWRKSVESLGLKQMCQDFIGGISDEATRKLKSFEDELSQNLRYGGEDFTLPSIQMDDITDWQGRFMLLAPALAWIPGVGWAGAAIFFGLAWLFGDSKEEKIRKAKQELRGELEKSKNDIMKKVSKGVWDILKKCILQGQIWGFYDILVKRMLMFGNLAYTQNVIADTINRQYSVLNFDLLFCAGEFYDSSVGMKDVRIIRIVGKEFIIFTTTLPPSNEKTALKRVLNEKTMIAVVNDDSYWDDIHQLQKIILQKVKSLLKILLKKNGGR